MKSVPGGCTKECEGRELKTGIGFKRGGVECARGRWNAEYGSDRHPYQAGRRRRRQQPRTKLTRVHESVELEQD